MAGHQGRGYGGMEAEARVSLEVQSQTRGGGSAIQEPKMDGEPTLVGTKQRLLVSGTCLGF